MRSFSQFRVHSLLFASLSMTSNVIPSVSKESTHGCSASLSMTSDVIPSASEESAHGCFAALSMTEPKVSFRTPVRNPQHGCFAALSMTGWGQQTSPSCPSPCKRRGTFWRKPKQGEVARSSKHFFVIPSIFFCHSKCSFLSFQA